MCDLSWKKNYSKSRTKKPEDEAKNQGGLETHTSKPNEGTLAGVWPAGFQSCFDQWLRFTSTSLIFELECLQLLTYAHATIVCLEFPRLITIFSFTAPQLEKNRAPGTVLNGSHLGTSVIPAPNFSGLRAEDTMGWDSQESWERVNVF